MNRLTRLASAVVPLVVICVVARAWSAEPAKPSAKATVKVVGELGCAKCDLGLGTECAVGLKIGSTVLALANNEASQRIFDARPLADFHVHRMPR